jgi:hypothetical protein
MHHHKVRGLGLVIMGGDPSSDLPTLFSIDIERRIQLEEAVNSEVKSSSSYSYLSVLDIIRQTAQNTNELAYSMYYFGTKQFKSSLRSLDIILPDD